MEERTQTNNH